MKNTRFDSLMSTRLPRELQLKRMQRVIEEELTAVQKETLLAYYLEDLTLEQIAARRGVTRPTVWRTLRRAENTLRRLLRY
ncbi:MAG: sigma-70 family RNA polymerase sigma factor [Oscillospiraceae bacterium]|nr:sigma-70 family RNA polymerase sigma factor [Oscillospiraceae bacterium]